MKATCTWGQGPDVLLELDGTGVVCYEDPFNYPPPRGRYKHGIISQGSTDLTIIEAKALIASLTAAVKKADELYQSYEDYCDNSSNNNIEE